MTWISTLITLAWRDIRSSPRQPWFYPKRLMFGGLVTILLISSFGLLTSKMPIPGLFIFKFLTVGIVVLAIFTALASGATSLNQDRPTQTLDLLIISEVTSLQFILAKHLAGLLLALQTLIIAAPMLAICAALGGINPSIALAGGALLTAVTMCSHGMGLAIAARFTTPRQIRVYCGAVTMAVFVIAPVIVIMVASLIVTETRSVMVVVSPIAAMLSLFGDQPVTIAGIHIIILIVADLLALIFATCWLPGSLIPAETSRFSKLASDLRSTRTMKALHQRPQVEGNPITWMDLYLVFGGTRINWLRLVFASCLIIVIVLTFSSIIDLSLEESWYKTWTFLTIFYGLTYAFTTISAASMAFQREQQNGSLDILLTSDLTDSDLMVGKMIGILTGASPYGICLLVCFCSTFLLNEDMTKVITLLISSIIMLCVWFSSCTMALYYSVRWRAPAGLTAFGVVYALIWAVICTFFPRWQNGVGAYFILGLIAVIWHGYIGHIVWRLMLSQGRNMLLSIPLTGQTHREL